MSRKMRVRVSVRARRRTIVKRLEEEEAGEGEVEESEDDAMEDGVEGVVGRGGKRGAKVGLAFFQRYQ